MEVTTLKKLIGIDLDGTLLNSKQQINSKDVETLKHNKDFTFICSGRDASDIQKILAQNNLSMPVVGLNGAIGLNSMGKTLFTCSIPIPDFYYMYLNLRILDLPFKIYSSMGTFESNNYTRSLKHTLNKKDEILQEDKNELEYLINYEKTIISKNIEEFFCLINNPEFEIRKIFVYAPDPLIKKRVRYHFATISSIYCTESSPVNIEILPKAATKAKAFDKLAIYYNFSDYCKIAIGDSLNDKDMLKAADFSIVMENGDDSLKYEANYITADNDHCGVSQALNLIGVASI